MKRVLLILLLFVSPAWAQKRASELIVGMELTYPPFEMVDKNGKPAGICVDMANAFGAYLEKKVIIENIPFIGLIPALDSKKIDLILSSLTVTAQRIEAIDFSHPYFETGLCLLVNIHSNVRSVGDLNIKGRVVVVKQGTTGQTYAQEYLKLARLIILDREESCVFEVVKGKADAFIYDQLSVYTQWQKNLETTQAILTPFKKEYWAIGVRKGNQGLLDEVNAFLRDFRKEGGFEALGDKYLKKQKEAFQQLGIPFYF